MQEISGTLFIVATPIGNLGDITTRAIETLSAVDKIYAEDTRNSLKLLHYFNIKTSISALHDHNETQKIDEVAGLLEQGKNLALISDAGTPLISDPGYKLVRELGKKGFSIVPIPGASAIITALSIAGIPTNKFSFEGFLPAKASGRLQALTCNAKSTYTQVYYESSHRIVVCIDNMVEVMGGNREVALARELTKLYEQVYRGTLSELSDWLKSDSNHQKGEFVIILKAYDSDEVMTSTELDNNELIRILAMELPAKQAAAITAKLTKLSKNEAYKVAISFKQ